MTETLFRNMDCITYVFPDEIVAMSIFKRINNFFNNDSDQPDDQPTKIVWTKISEPVQEHHSEDRI